MAYTFALFDELRYKFGAFSLRLSCYVRVAINWVSDYGDSPPKKRAPTSWKPTRSQIITPQAA